MIPFNKPWFTGREGEAVMDAHHRGHLSGDGHYTRECERILQDVFGVRRALLTHSCTAALEMAALLIDLAPGDEVIMPSFTFVSTANAFVLRGAVPVFVDIERETLNLDVARVEAAITARTRAVVAVHYAGVLCDMPALRAICDRHGLVLIEDAAQSFGSTTDGASAGRYGDIACISFHETKNISCGEGGALLTSRAPYVERAEIFREKGTNRSRFFRGEVDKYTWVDVGSSYIPSEIIAAVLHCQLQAREAILSTRLAAWTRYQDELRQPAASAGAAVPPVSATQGHNGHIFHLIFDGIDRRDRFIREMRSRGVYCVFHYVPLHSAPAGLRLARAASELPVTDAVSSGLVRLPLWHGVDAVQGEIIEAAISVLAIA